MVDPFQAQNFSPWPGSGYKPQAEDTCVESDVFQFSLLQQRTVAQRWMMAAKLTRWARAVALRGMRRARGKDFPEFFAKSVLQEKWLPVLTPCAENTAMWIQDPGEIARLLHPIFEQLQISYYITGGVAAIAYGDPRTTRDLDIVIAITSNDLGQLVSALEAAGFYCPPGAVEDIQRGRGKTLSVTHMQMVLNADLVINGDTDFDRTKMARRQLEALDEAGQEYFYLSSPEDVILSKLVWRQRSQSEKQWRDVLGVLKVQGEALDFEYLQQWAEPLAIAPDLTQALIEAGLAQPN